MMKTKIEELIDEKLNQEFPEEVEIRENQDYDSEEEMTSETEETDDESEPNNANVNNYLDTADMVMNLETAMKIAEEEDLWIGDSGVSSHMMGSEEHVFNHDIQSKMGNMIKEWVVFNKLEDFNSLLKYTDDDFTPIGIFMLYQ